MQDILFVLDTGRRASAVTVESSSRYLYFMLFEQQKMVFLLNNCCWSSAEYASIYSSTKDLQM